MKHSIIEQGIHQLVTHPLSPLRPAAVSMGMLTLLQTHITFQQSVTSLSFLRQE